MSSLRFGTFIISPHVFTHHQILLTSCRESVRKGLIRCAYPHVRAGTRVSRAHPRARSPVAGGRKLCRAPYGLAHS